MNWRKTLRWLHRDLGFLICGITLVYAMSGIALNHMDQWNPSYTIEKKEFSLQLPQTQSEYSSIQVQSALQKADISWKYRKHYREGDRLKIFVKGGSVEVSLSDGAAIGERLTRRPFFFQINRLHFNRVTAWRYVSDFFALVLIFVAISGLFIVKGNKGLKGRGGWLTLIGIVVPLGFALFLI